MAKKKRPSDVVGNAVRVMRIATGQMSPDDKPAPLSGAAELGRKGGAARAAKMSPERRSEIAKQAAKKRWDKAG